MYVRKVVEYKGVEISVGTERIYQQRAKLRSVERSRHRTKGYVVGDCKASVSVERHGRRWHLRRQEQPQDGFTLEPGRIKRTGSTRPRRNGDNAITKTTAKTKYRRGSASQSMRQSLDGVKFAHHLWLNLRATDEPTKAPRSQPPAQVGPKERPETPHTAPSPTGRILGLTGTSLSQRLADLVQVWRRRTSAVTGSRVGARRTRV